MRTRSSHLQIKRVRVMCAVLFRRPASVRTRRVNVAPVSSHHQQCTYKWSHISPSIRTDKQIHKSSRDCVCWQSVHASRFFLCSSCLRVKSVHRKTVWGRDLDKDFSLCIHLEQDIIPVTLLSFVQNLGLGSKTVYLLTWNRSCCNSRGRWRRSTASQWGQDEVIFLLTNSN